MVERSLAEKYSFLQVIIVLAITFFVCEMFFHVFAYDVVMNRMFMISVFHIFSYCLIASCIIYSISVLTFSLIGAVLIALIYLMYLSSFIYFQIMHQFPSVYLIQLIPQLSDVYGIVWDYITIWHLLVVICVVILIYIFHKALIFEKEKLQGNRVVKSIMFVALIYLFVVYFAGFYTVKAHNFKDRRYLAANKQADIVIKGYGLFNYYLISFKVDRYMANISSGNNYSDILNIYKPVFKETCITSQAGVKKKYNFVLIQWESLTTNIMGKQTTPNLLSFINRNDTFFYPNGKSTSYAGSSSDSEFSVLTGLYNDKRHISYIKYQNIYKDVPDLIQFLNNLGYETLFMHGNKRTFWNRYTNTKNIGFDRVYFETDFENNNPIVYDTALDGIDDKDLLQQSQEIIKNADRPFFAMIVTKTSHSPYKIRQNMLKKKCSGQICRYKNVTKYTDKYVGNFIKWLKKQALWRDTVVMIYGDHPAVLKNGGRNFNIREQKIPLIIRIPGVKNNTAKYSWDQTYLFPSIVNMIKPGCVDNSTHIINFIYNNT